MTDHVQLLPWLNEALVMAEGGAKGVRTDDLHYGLFVFVILNPQVY